MKKVLLYHIFPVNNWKEVTERILSRVPHDDIFVHVSLNSTITASADEVRRFFEPVRKIAAIFFSENSVHPEVDAMHAFRSHIDFGNYGMLTYMHSKGVTQPQNKNIREWTEMMRYFIIDKMSLCEDVFRKGFLLYGVNKTKVVDEDKDFNGAEFFYAGNFVSLNLTPGMAQKIRVTQPQQQYYGLEGYWGRLCSSRLAYNAFHSRVNHYVTSFPEHHYKSTFGRFRYSIVSLVYERYYALKHKRTCLI